MIMNIETWFPTSIYYDDLEPDEEVGNNMFSFIESFYEKKQNLNPISITLLGMLLVIIVFIMTQLLIG